MSNAGHVRASETAARRAGSSKAHKRRSRKNGGHKNHTHKNRTHKNSASQNGVPGPAGAQHEVTGRESATDETVIRAKGLLAATLRVWELKNRVED